MRPFVAFLFLAVASMTALAMEHDLNIELEYLPQETVSAPSVQVSTELTRHPVRVRLKDARGSDPARLGTRTDDDDQLFELRTDNDVVGYVQSIIEENFERWNITVDEQANLMLRGDLAGLEITERNMAVGASYTADVRVEFVLTDDDRIVWKGTGWADASRYGRKFSNENCNEVLSDAMTEAFATLFDDIEFRSAWSGDEPTRAMATTMVAATTVAGKPEPGASVGISGDEPAVAGNPMSAEELLTQLILLIDEDFETETLIEYVSQQTLESRLSSSDLLAWKEEDIPEKVIRAALNLPVR
jgi:hypothetical protein